MKKFVSLLFILFLGLGLYAQDISGDWYGVLNIQGIKLRIILHIKRVGDSYKAKMDSPDQNAYGIPVTKTNFKDSKLILIVSSAGIRYEGKYENNIIKGIFRQSGLNLPLKLTRKEIPKPKLKRPQEPKKPYPYYSEEVRFKNIKDNIILAGTLTLPKKAGKFPAVIFITGSGPQNRDEEVFGHKPFLVISDYLTRHGIATLRFDDRGTGKSTGDFRKATTLDFVKDVEAAIEYLKTRKEIDKEKIGLIGHSEGGIIAPIVASKSNDVSFIILLAGTGIRGDRLLLLQTKAIMKASGVSDEKIKNALKINKEIYDIILNSQDVKEITRELSNYFKKADLKSEIPKGVKKEDFIKLQINQLTSPWFIFFLKYDPAPALEKVKCPVLALNGSKDTQVSANENLKAIKKALEKGRNKDFKVIKIEGLNHLFQECKTGSPMEYSKIEQTFSQKALKIIKNWILKQVNKNK